MYGMYYKHVTVSFVLPGKSSMHTVVYSDSSRSILVTIMKQNIRGRSHKHSRKNMESNKHELA